MRALVPQTRGQLPRAELAAETAMAQRLGDAWAGCWLIITG